MPRTSKNINIEIGHRIKQERLNQKLICEQLAHLVGYSANFKWNVADLDCLQNLCGLFLLRSKCPRIICCLVFHPKVMIIYAQN